jgi:hypothetical protein
MKFTNYQEEIEKWLNDKNITNFTPLSQNKEFKEFIRTHFPGMSEVDLVNAIHKCSIAIGKEDVNTFSNCVASSLTTLAQGK